MRRLTRAAASAARWSALALATAGCAAAPPRSAPVDWRGTAVELMPSDLDFAVRLDAQALSQSGFAAALPTLALGQAGTAGAVRATLLQLDRARAIHFGGRIMTDGLHGDGVVVVEQVGPTAPLPGASFHEIGARAGARLFERAGPTAAARDESVLQVMLPSGIVLATASEVDAVLRVLDSGPDRERIEVPARGLVSFAGRVPRGLTRAAWPVLLRGAGEGLLRYEGGVDLAAAPATDLRVELELSYGSESAAEAAKIELRAVAERVIAGAGAAPGNSAAPEWRVAAQSLEVVRAASGLRVTLRVPFALFRAVH